MDRVTAQPKHPRTSLSPFNFFRRTRQSFAFRIFVPILLFVFLVAVALKLMVAQSVREFSSEQTKENLYWLKRSVFFIVDSRYEEAMRGSHKNNPGILQMQKVSALVSIEDFLRALDASAVIYDTESKSIFFKSPLPDQDFAVIRNALIEDKVSSVKHYLDNYSITVTDFPQWNWRIVLLKSYEGSYDDLIANSYRTVVVAAFFVLVITALFLYLYLNFAIRKPINSIVSAVAEDERPEYQGIYEFEFLSNSIVQMMDAVHEKHQLYEHTNASLERARSQLQDAIESMSDGFALFDSDKKLVMCNTRYHDFYGKHAVVAGLDYCTLIRRIYEEGRVDLPGEQVEKWLASRFDSVGNGFEKQRLKLADGRVIEFQEFMTNDNGIVSVHTDISDRRRVEKAMKEAHRQAVETAKLKSEFLANMSHEIRTPLNGILGITELLKKSSLDDKQTHFVQLVSQSGKSLLTIVNDILDFSKIEAGKLELESIEFDLRELVEETCEFHAEAAYRKGLEFVVDVAPDIRDKVCGDALRIRQVLTNLIGNAIKFTDQGQIVVKATPKKHEDGAQRLRFEVQDSGLGMGPEACERVFAAFSQADTSSTRKFGGTGLGLSICKQLVELMDGGIGVDSTVGEGSVFWFELPMDSAEQLDLSSVTADGTPLADHSVLLLTRTNSQGDALQCQCEAWGARIERATNVGDAQQKLRDAFQSDRFYHAVLLDGEYDDVDLLLRDLTTFAGVGKRALTVVMRSAFDPAEKSWPEKTQLLNKPVRQESLLRCLTNFEDTAHSRIAEADQTASSITIAARILVAEDNQVNQVLIREVLSRLGCKAEIVDNGEFAVEAVQSKNYDLILMDCQMPRMDGYSATQAIRRNPNCHQLPIIALTANAMKDDREKCIAAGMDDYLSKPFAEEQLALLLARWLPDHTHENTAAPVSEAPVQGLPAEVLDEDSPMDRSALAAITAMDPDGKAGFLQSLFGAYLASSGPDMAALAQALEESAGKEIAKLTHRLKTSAANVAALTLADLFRRMEQAAKVEQLAECEKLYQTIEIEQRRVCHALTKLMESADAA